MKTVWKITLSVTAVITVFTMLAIYVSAVYLSKSSKENILRIFKDEVKTLALNDENSIILALQNKPDFGYFYIIDREGNTIVHTIKERIGLNLVKEGLEDLYKTIVTKKSGVYSYVYNGDKIYVAFAQTSNYFLARAVTEKELMADIRQGFRTVLYFSIPLVAILALIISFVTTELSMRNPKKQVKESQNFADNVKERISDAFNLIDTFSHGAERTGQTISQLDKSIEDFSAYLEETNAEVETIVQRIADFTNVIENIANSSSQLASLNETISKLSDQITDISDTISVLAINSSIETSKQNIDREGLSRISEMIMELSNQVRNIAKEAKESLMSNEKIITSTVLLTEKISKELNYVRESLNTIQSVVNANAQTVDKLVKISAESRDSIGEIVSSIKITQDILSKLNSEVNSFVEKLKKIDI